VALLFHSYYPKMDQKSQIIKLIQHSLQVLMLKVELLMRKSL